jgi:hypothetical protein
LTKTKKIILLSLATLFVAFCGFAAWYYMPFKQGQGLTVYCYNMQYACGDCYEQEWRVTAIVGEGEEKFQHLVNTDIIVHYSESFQKQLDKDPNAHCFGCFRFTFTGMLYYSQAKGYILESSHNQYKIQKDCCSPLPGKDE